MQGVYSRMSCHEGVSCNACSRPSFRGKRYKCLICFDYDLCERCYEEGVTDTAHKTEHAVQCILTQVDLELYYGAEDAKQVQSFTLSHVRHHGIHADWAAGARDVRAHGNRNARGVPGVCRDSRREPEQRHRRPRRAPCLRTLEEPRRPGRPVPFATPAESPSDGRAWQLWQLLSRSETAKTTAASRDVDGCAARIGAAGASWLSDGGSAAANEAPGRPAADADGVSGTGPASTA
ncbi:uncharacterized protein LOC144161995 isoform X1 [Haemaphysalis longicornis]